MPKAGTKQRKRSKDGKKSTSSSKTLSSKQISAPSAQTRRLTRTGRPDQKHLPNGDCIISHEEVNVELVATDSEFDAVGYAINPANEVLFPWLSQIALGYESYVFEQLEFEFMTDVGTQIPGAVYMAVDYDVNDPLPQSKRDLMSYRGAVRSALWDQQLVMRCDKEDLSKRKSYYIVPDATVETAGRGQSAPPIGQSGDNRLDDVGRFILASQGVVDGGFNVPLGDILVRYRVRLMTPQRDLVANSSGFSLQSEPGTTGLSPAAVMGTTVPSNSNGVFENSQALFSNNGVGYTVTASGDGSPYRFTFTEPGTYYISFWCQATAMTTPGVHYKGYGQCLVVPGSEFNIFTTGGICSMVAVVLDPSLVPDAAGRLGSLKIDAVGLATTITWSLCRIIRGPPYNIGGTGGMNLKGSMFRPPSRMVLRNKLRFAGDSRTKPTEKKARSLECSLDNRMSGPTPGTEDLLALLRSLSSRVDALAAQGREKED